MYCLIILCLCLLCMFQLVSQSCTTFTSYMGPIVHTYSALSLLNKPIARKINRVRRPVSLNDSPCVQDVVTLSPIFGSATPVHHVISPSVWSGSHPLCVDDALVLSGHTTRPLPRLLIQAVLLCCAALFLQLHHLHDEQKQTTDQAADTWGFTVTDLFQSVAVAERKQTWKASIYLVWFT